MDPGASELSSGLVIAGGVVAVVLMISNMLFLATRYKKAGPNEALIISGRGRTQYIVGGAGFVWPYVQTMQRLSLEPHMIEATAEERVDGGRRSSSGQE